MLKAVIFDMDGVLLDSESVHYYVMKDIMAEYGYYYTPERFLKFCGVSEDLMWPQLLQEAELLHLDPSELTKWHWEVYNAKLQKEGMPVFSGLKEFLDKIKGNGYKLAVASASRPQVILENLRKLDIWEYFDSIVSSVVCEKGKPEPDVFLLAAEQLGVKPRECLVVEDSVNGFIAAEKAGMVCVGFTGAEIKPEVCKAEYSFSDYGKIEPEQLERWYEEAHK